MRKSKMEVLLCKT